MAAAAGILPLVPGRGGEKNKNKGRGAIRVRVTKNHFSSVNNQIKVVCG